MNDKEPYLVYYCNIKEYHGKFDPVTGMREYEHRSLCENENLNCKRFEWKILARLFNRDKIKFCCNCIHCKSYHNWRTFY
jgi:hypothetical protein